MLYHDIMLCNKQVKILACFQNIKSTLQIIQCYLIHNHIKKNPGYQDFKYRNALFITYTYYRHSHNEIEFSEIEGGNYISPIILSSTVAICYVPNIPPSKLLLKIWGDTFSGPLTLLSHSHISVQNPSLFLSMTNFIALFTSFMIPATSPPRFKMPCGNTLKRWQWSRWSYPGGVKLDNGPFKGWRERQPIYSRTRTNEMNDRPTMEQKQRKRLLLIDVFMLFSGVEMLKRNHFLS